MLKFSGRTAIQIVFHKVLICFQPQLICFNLRITISNFTGHTQCIKNNSCFLCEHVQEIPGSDTTLYASQLSMTPPKVSTQSFDIKTLMFLMATRMYPMETKHVKSY